MSDERKRPRVTLAPVGIGDDLDGYLAANEEAESYRVVEQEGTTMLVGEVVTIGDVGAMIQLNQIDVQFQRPTTREPKPAAAKAPDDVPLD